MRKMLSGYGPHLLRHASTVRQWTLDESTATDSALDVHGVTLADTGDPGVSAASPCGPNCRTFVTASGQYFSGGTAGADAAVFIGAPYTVEVVAKITATPAASRAFYAYAGNGNTEALNIAFLLGVNTSKQIIVQWEHGAGTLETYTFTGFTFTLGCWQHIAVTFDSPRLRLYVDGILVEEKEIDGGDDATGATSSQHSIGTSLSSAAGMALTGAIAHVIIHTEELTAQQVADSFRHMMMWDQYSHIDLRVDVENGDGDMVCLNNYFQQDWVEGVVFSDDVDNQFEQVTLHLRRETGLDDNVLSLAPYHDNRMSRLPITALGPDDGTYTEVSSETLGPDRDVNVYLARVPWGLTLTNNYASSKWQKWFEGRSRKPQWGDHTIRLECHDKGAILVRAFILDPIEDLAAPPPGTPVGELIQEILDEAVDRGHIPMADSFTLLDRSTSDPWSFEGDAEGKSAFPPQMAMEMIDGLAQQRGDRVRWKWDDETGAFGLAMSTPNRDQTIPTCPISYDNYVDIRDIDIDVAWIRTSIKVAYIPSPEETERPADVGGHTITWTGSFGTFDGGTIFWEGPGKSAFVLVRAAGEGGLPDTIDKYGGQDVSAALAEEATSQIQYAEQAYNYGVAVLKDLCDPKASKSVDAFALPELQIGDMPLWYGNGRHYTADQTFALTGRELALQGGDGGRTTIQASGRPIGGAMVHRKKEGRGGIARPTVEARLISTLFTWSELYAPIQILFRLFPDIFLINGTAIFGGFLDGWEVIDGEVPDDLFADTEFTHDNAKSMHFLKHFSDANVEVQNDFFRPVTPGGVFTAELWATGLYSFDTYDGGAEWDFAADFLADVDWYDEDKVYISSTNLHDHGSGNFNPGNAGASYRGEFGGTATGLNWSHTRVVMIAPPTARFCKIHIYDIVASGTVGDDDEVGMLICAPVVLTDGTPSFLAYLAADETFAGNSDPVEFDTEEHDDGACYDTTTWTFTAPVNGLYEFKARVRMNDATLTAGSALTLKKNGSSWIPGIPGPAADGSGDVRLAIESGFRALAAGDTITVTVTKVGGSGPPTIKGGAGETWFSGRKL